MNLEGAPLPVGCVTQCRGCSHRHLTGSESRAQKQEYVKNILFHAYRVPAKAKTFIATDELEFSSLQELPKGILNSVDEIRYEFSQNMWRGNLLGYRGRGLLHVHRDLGKNKSQWKIGLLRKCITIDKEGRKKFYNDLLEIPDCPIHRPEVNGFLKNLKENFLEKLDPKTDFPLVKIVFQWPLVILVLKRKRDPDWENLQSELPTNFFDPKKVGVFFNFHPGAGNRSLSHGQTVHWHGLKKGFVDSGNQFNQPLAYGPGHFVQVADSGLYSELYSDALKEAAEFFKATHSIASNHLFDVYCGIGVSSAYFVKQGFEVSGIELNGEALEYARTNVPGARFYQGKAEHRLPAVGVPFVFMNPPRSGCVSRDGNNYFWDLSFWKKVQKIAYLSCEPKSLVVDLRNLEARGFKMVRVIPFDFFPLTRHVETLVLLERIGS